jgi:hypothetical protein
MFWIIQLLHRFIHTRMDQLYGILPYDNPDHNDHLYNVLPEACSMFCAEKYGQSYDMPVSGSSTYRSSTYRSSRSNTFMGMPEYLQKGLQTYSSEIYGTITDTQLHLGETNARLLLKKFVNTLNITSLETFQIYEYELPHRYEGAIFTLTYSHPYWDIVSAYPGYVVNSIHRMNELTLLSHVEDYPYTTHPRMDGIFTWLPWCNVIRCIMIIDGIASFEFPLSTKTYLIERGDYLLYDYNRGIYIPSSVSSNKPILLNLHYIVYPEWFPKVIIHIYMWIHRIYSMFSRNITNMLKTGEKHEHTFLLRECVSDILRIFSVLYMKTFLVSAFLWKYMCGE